MAFSTVEYDFDSPPMNTIVEQATKYYCEQIESEVKKMLIEHGYEKQIDKAINGKTQSIRTRNRNIIKNLVEVVYFPVKFDGMSATQPVEIVWKGQ